MKKTSLFILSAIISQVVFSQNTDSTKKKSASFAIAGLLKEKKYAPLSAGSLRTNSTTFGIFLFTVIIILNALPMFISLMLGPISEYFSMH
jgi:Potassium-transporting ATPase A subunit